MGRRTICTSASTTSHRPCSPGTRRREQRKPQYWPTLKSNISGRLVYGVLTGLVMRHQRMVRHARGRSFVLLARLLSFLGDDPLLQVSAVVFCRLLPGFTDGFLAHPVRVGHRASTDEA